MSRPTLRPGLLLLVIGCTRAETPAPPRSAAPDWSVNATAIGAARFGQPVADFARAQGTVPDTSVGAECEYWWPAGAPAGLSLMVDRGRVVRADLDSLGPKTDKGVGLGSSIGEVQAVYPGAESAPHKYNYDQGWRTLTVMESDSSAALVFEVDSAVVRQVHAGRLPYALWVERCS